MKMMTTVLDLSIAVLSRKYHELKDDFDAADDTTGRPGPGRRLKTLFTH